MCVQKGASLQVSVWHVDGGGCLMLDVPGGTGVVVDRVLGSVEECAGGLRRSWYDPGRAALGTAWV